jgi:hypothetical protein
MAEKPQKVKIKLAAACYVGGKLRAAGEEVEIREDLVESFSVPAGETLESLLALGKKKLLELADERQVEGVTKDNNADEIAKKIFEADK